MLEVSGPIVWCRGPEPNSGLRLSEGLIWKKDFARSSFFLGLTPFKNLRTHQNWHTGQKRQKFYILIKNTRICSIAPQNTTFIIRWNQTCILAMYIPEVSYRVKLGLQWVSELIRIELVERKESLCLLADEIFTMVPHRDLSEGFSSLRVSKVILVLLLSDERGETALLYASVRIKSCQRVIMSDIHKQGGNESDEMMSV